MNGWDDNGYRQGNLVNGNWFGLVIEKYSNGNLFSMGLFINDYWFGWCVEYDIDGSIDTKQSGFYLKNEKI